MVEQLPDNWFQIQADSRVALREMELHIESLAKEPRFGLDHDLDWIQANTSEEDGVRIYRTDAQGVPVGYAPFHIAQAKLPVHLGELSIWSFQVREFRLIAGPVLRHDSTSSRVNSFANLLCIMRPSLKGKEVIFLGRLDTMWFSELKNHTQLRKSFYLLPWGSAQIQRVIRLPDSYDAYLTELGRRTRADLRRQYRSLVKATDEQVEVKVYADPGAVVEFLDDASRVSERTYQWHLLARGLRDQVSMERKLKISSSKGWMRCYVLFCKSEPVAFMVGFAYHKRYLSTDIGFDPSWGRFSVGNVLHCAVIDDLIKNRPDIHLFDFIGDNSNKRRLSNAVDGEAMDLYLIPRSAFGAFAYASLVTSIAISAWAGRLLDQLGLKERFRKILHRWSTG